MLIVVLTLALIGLSVLVFLRAGLDRGLVIGLLAAFRNIGVVMAALGANAARPRRSYFAMVQFPIFLLPAHSAAAGAAACGKALTAGPDCAAEHCPLPRRMIPEWHKEAAMRARYSSRPRSSPPTSPAGRRGPRRRGRRRRLDPRRRDGRPLRAEHHHRPDVVQGDAPASRKKPLDVHLMIAPADPYLEAFAKAGADIITVHVEAGPHLHRSLQAIRALGKKAGVAFNPARRSTSIEHVLDLVDLVLVMRVNPGFGGQTSSPPRSTRSRGVRALVDDAADRHRGRWRRHRRERRRSRPSRRQCARRRLRGLQGGSLRTANIAAIRLRRRGARRSRLTVATCSKAERHADRIPNVCPRPVVALAFQRVAGKCRRISGLLEPRETVLWPRPLTRVDAADAERVVVGRCAVDGGRAYSSLARTDPQRRDRS